MKQCPKCGSTYTDESLSFCLTDGSPLVDEPAATEIFAAEPRSTSESAGTTDGGKIRFEIPEKEEETLSRRSAVSSGDSSARKGFGFGLVALVVVALLIVIAVLSGLVVYMMMKSGETATTTAANSSSTPDDVEELKKRIEELGGRIENSESNDKVSPSPTRQPVEEDEPEFDDEVIQRVNSPSDGFLALRDQPSAKFGSRIAKIPHGDIVVLGKCTDDAETIGGRTGHWCRVRWEGKTGWVFDVWLTD